MPCHAMPSLLVLKLRGRVSQSLHGGMKVRMQVDVASSEAMEAVLRSIQQILCAASSGHCVTGFDYPNTDGLLYTLVDSETEVNLSCALHTTNLLILSKKTCTTALETEIQL